MSGEQVETVSLKDQQGAESKSTADGEEGKDSTNEGPVIADTEGSGEQKGEVNEAEVEISEARDGATENSGAEEVKESEEDGVDEAPSMLEGSSFAAVKLAIVQAINEYVSQFSPSP